MVATVERFQLEKRVDGIIVYRLADLLRESIDAFTEAATKTDLWAVENDCHARCLLDITKIRFPNPYAISRIQTLIKSTPDEIRESFAVLTPTSNLYSFARAIINHIPQSKTNSIRFFREEAEALAWLDERLQEIGP